MMKDSRSMSTMELWSFLRSSEALAFISSSCAETYPWIERTLR